MRLRRHTTVASALVVVLAAGGAWALPGFTVSRAYRSGNAVTGVGQINSPFFGGGSGGSTGGTGFFQLSVNNTNAGEVLVGLYRPAGFEFGLLNLATGLTPVLAAGAEYNMPPTFPSDPGFITVPSTDYVFDTGYRVATNNNGNGLTSLRVRSSDFAAVQPLTGVYFNTTAMPIKEGDVVTAPGVAAGTAFAPFSAAGNIGLTDSNVALIATKIVESGVTKNAILKVALSAAGAVLSEQLVVKEGGPVGAGPATWTAVSIAAETCAINNAGLVIFSGTTSTGASGLYLGNSFVATTGGAAPGGGVWDPLFGAPVDLANNGQFVFRGVVPGSGLWAEQGDAGDTFSSSFTYTANPTFGGGPLTEISGQLANDQDVDFYFISIGDATLQTQEPFSATTVPNPGAGFTGAAFDSVLYLMQPDFNANGNFRTCLGRSDNVSASVLQSTLTTASLSTHHTAGKKYMLAISTPKARAYGGYTNDTPVDMWEADPAKVAIAQGMIFYIDPSEGQVGRASLASGTLLSPLQVAAPPAQTTEQQSTPGDGLLISDSVAAYDAGAASKVYFYQHSFGTSAIRRCSPDGSGLEDVVASGLPSASNLTSMTIDSVHGVLYWAQYVPGNTQINSSDLTGSSRQTVLMLNPPAFDTLNALAVDTAGTGKIYWNDATTNTVVRADLTGANVQTVASGLGATAISIDSAARRLYFASGLDRVGAINIDTLAVLPDLAATVGPSGVAVDAAGGRVYWTNPLERVIRRTLVSAPSTETWLPVGADVGEHPGDGPGYLTPYKLFKRFGVAGGAALPYRIKLTGATFVNQAAMICRNNKVKVVAAGDAPAATGNRVVTAAGGAASGLRISDRGVVTWRGRWQDAAGATRTGLFANQTKLFDDQTVLGAPGTDPLGTVDAGIGSIDMSGSGRYLLVKTDFGGFSSPTPGDNAVSVAFSAVPGCAADFNGSGTISVQDIFDFLTAYFSASPTADFNGSGVVSVQDIFDFLAAWFAPCTP